MSIGAFKVKVESVAADEPPETLIKKLCEFSRRIGAMVECDDVNGKVVIATPDSDPDQVIRQWRTMPEFKHYDRMSVNIDYKQDWVQRPEGSYLWPPRYGQPVVFSANKSAEKPAPSRHSPEGHREVEYRRMQWFGIVLAVFPALYLGLYGFALILQRLADWRWQ